MSAGRTALFVLMDAVGWQILRESDFLEEIAPHRHRLRTVLGYSSAALPAIYTGLHPAECGHWFMFLRARRRSVLWPARLISMLPGSIRERGGVRNRLKEWVATRGKVTGYFDLYCVPYWALCLFDLCEKSDIYEPGGINRGNSIFDVLEQRSVDHRVWSWRVPHDRGLEELKTDIKEVGRRFYFYYTYHFDDLMHRGGASRQVVEEGIDTFGKEIQGAVEAANARGMEVALYVMSDHGMRDVTGTCDVMSAIASSGAAWGRDYIAFYDSTFARFWFRSRQGEELVKSALEAVPGGRILEDRELDDLGALFPEREFGETIFLADPGVVVHPNFMGPSPPRAMHGYHPDDPWSDAALLTNQELSVAPTHITDLFGIMCEEAQPAGERQAADPRRR